MGQQFGRAANELAVGLVTDQPLDLDSDRLLHLVADDAAGELARTLLRDDAFACDGSGLLSHFTASGRPSLRACSRCTVFNRAMLRRTFVNWSGFGDWPV